MNFQVAKFKIGNVHSISIRYEWNCSLAPRLLLTKLQLYHFHLRSLLRSVTLPACRFSASPSASCCTALLRFSRFFAAGLTTFPYFLRLFFIQCFCAVLCSATSVVSDSLRPCGLQPARLLCPWDFPGRILEWVAMPSSRGSSQPRDRTLISSVSCIAGGFFAAEPPRKHIICGKSIINLSQSSTPYSRLHHLGP